MSVEGVLWSGYGGSQVHIGLLVWNGCGATPSNTRVHSREYPLCFGNSLTCFNCFAYRGFICWWTWLPGLILNVVHTFKYIEIQKLSMEDIGRSRELQLDENPASAEVRFCVMLCFPCIHEFVVMGSAFLYPGRQCEWGACYFLELHKVRVAPLLRCRFEIMY